MVHLFLHPGDDLRIMFLSRLTRSRVILELYLVLSASLSFIFLLLHLDAISLMPPHCNSNTSSLPNVNASSSLPSHNAVSLKQVAFVSQDLRKQPLVDCWWLPAVGARPYPNDAAAAASHFKYCTWYNIELPHPELLLEMKEKLSFPNPLSKSQRPHWQKLKLNMSHDSGSIRRRSPCQAPNLSLNARL